MGKSNEFEKRKARAQAAMERRTAKREPYDVVLVVCEGSKTEPYYLNAMKDDLELGNANVKIVEEHHGTDPLSVVNFALTYYDAEPIYDRIYCVFDKDGHKTYMPALNLVNQHPLRRQGKLFAINSVPCFEVWLLLHFAYTAKAYVKTGKNSSCDLVIRDLKNSILGYDKGHKSVYEIVKGKTADAIKHAKRLHKYTASVGTDNPSTRLHDLVEYFRELSEKRKRG